jgi:hypothetical protein
MDNWKDRLNDFIPVIALMVVIDMLKSIIASDLEKKLGRKLTDWEWQYYLQESNRKAEADSRQQTTKRWRQYLLDRQVIYDFVWEGG